MMYDIKKMRQFWISISITKITMKFVKAGMAQSKSNLLANQFETTPTTVKGQKRTKKMAQKRVNLNVFRENKQFI